VPHNAHFSPLVEGKKKREDGGGGRNEGEGEERRGRRRGRRRWGFVLVGASHKHHHLESLVSPCHGRHQKGGSRRCRGSRRGGGEPRRQVTQEVDRTVCPAGISRGEEAAPTGAMMPLSAMTTRRRRGHSGGVAGQERR